MNNLPTPIYDTLQNLLDEEAYLDAPDFILKSDFNIGRDFLISYRGSEDTFNSYRREVDRYLQWAYLKAEVTLENTSSEDVQEYLRFCNAPPIDWISTKNHPRFIVNSGVKNANPEWKPFLSKVNKQQHVNGESPKQKQYSLSNSAKAATLRILSSFFSFLQTRKYIDRNPVRDIRQKSQFIRTRSGPDPVRRLSPVNWEYVISVCTKVADEDSSHERGLFIISCLYAMYLRISELAKSDRHMPVMKDFFKSEDGDWFFMAVGKGNKERQITVSDDMLKALIRYREHLGLTPLPNQSDNHPLLSKQKGMGAISSTRQIRSIVQTYFDLAKEELIKDGLRVEADELSAATVHWLRHTGISDDIQFRPKEHVRDDAGHVSSAITDRYIDVEKRERHASSKNKPMRPA